MEKDLNVKSKIINTDRWKCVKKNNYELQSQRFFEKI